MKTKKVVYLVLFVIFFIFYIFTRAGQHTFDSFMFTYAIKVNQLLLSVFRPHNLFYLPTAIIFGKLLAFIGLASYINHPFLIGQIWAAFWGALSVCLFYFIACHIKKGLPALIITILFATSNCIWEMSTEVEVYTSSLAAVCCLYISMMSRKPSPIRIGIFWGLSILCHITNVLLVFPILIYSMLLLPQKKIKFALPILIIGGAIATAAYIFVGFFIIRAENISDILKYIESYTIKHQVFGILKIKQFLLGFLGLKRALVSGPAKIFMIFHFLLILLAFLSILKQKGLSQKISIVFFSHIIVYSVFFSWWEPLNIEFWVVTLLPIWLLIYMTWRFAAKKKLESYFIFIVFGAFIIQLFFNTKDIILRTDKSKDIWIQKAKLINKNITEKDMVLTFLDPLIYALPIEANHFNALAINTFSGGKNFGQAVREVSNLVKLAKQAGGKIYATQECLNPPDYHLRSLSITMDDYLRMIREMVGSDLTNVTPDGLLYY